MAILYSPEPNENKRPYWQNAAPYACVEPEIIELAAEQTERDLREVALWIACVLAAFWIAVS